MALCGVTPFALLARWIGRRALWLPLNAVQRALVYATVGTAAAQSYQHASYLSTLQDKKGTADLLRKIFGPGLERAVDKVVRESFEIE